MISKVCVRVPEAKREELMALAKQWRDEASADSIDRSPGWDAKAMHAAIRDNYGSLERFFKAQAWPERGSEMVPIVQKRVKDRFGSIEAFVESFDD